MFRRGAAGLEVLIAHPGGPYFRRKDRGVWTVPKGEIDARDDSELDAARREFTEETGFEVGEVEYLDLGVVRQRHKEVRVWAFEGDADPAELRSNVFEIEWPPRSGRRQTYPEIDRLRWVRPAEACALLIPAQATLVPRLLEALQLI